MTCPEIHSQIKTGEDYDGSWITGSNEHLVIEKLNGRILMYRAVCNVCGTRSSSMPKAVFVWRKWHCEVRTVERDNGVADETPCVVGGCPGRDIQWHHIAPRSVFGAAAEAWPIIPVCQPHHSEWHDAMADYNVFHKFLDGVREFGDDSDICQDIEAADRVLPSR